jgi:carboxyl-terminal processing protease
MRAVFGVILVASCAGSQPLPAPPAASPAASPASAPVPATPVPATAAPKDPRLVADLASFDKVWQTIADTFFDPKLGGLDWNALRGELRPEVAASKDREATRAVLNRLVSKLGKSHFGVWGAPELTGGQPKGDADVGLDVRILDGQPIIFRIEAGSPAAANAAAKRGLQIVEIDGVAIAPKLATIGKEMAGSSLVPLLQTRVVTHLLRGPADTPVKLVVTDGSPRGTRELVLVRKPAARMAKLGNLGPEPLIYEARWLDKQIAYLRLSVFLDPATVMPAIASDLAGFAKATGVIIDLRGNPGGIGGMAMGIAGYLIAEPDKKLGTMHTRQGALDFVINPQAMRFSGKVAVLIDELSASTSEIFAGGMQDLRRARVLGRQSPGAALPSVIDTLPNGDRFQYAIADYVSTSGKVLEGQGVVPDQLVRLDAKALRAGKDPDIVAATRWIKETK